MVEFGKQGELTKIKGVVEDVTERKEAEQLVSDAFVKEHSKNHAKNEFLATMGHELRTPLNSVIGFSQILSTKKFGPLNDKQQKYIQNILKNGKHLLNLINDFLDISKINAGKVELDLQPVSINGVFADSNQMIYPLAIEKNINI